MEVILFGTEICPRCNVLSKKLEKAGIPFVKITDEEEIMELGLKSVPWLSVNGNLLNMTEANNWIKEVSNK